MDKFRTWFVPVLLAASWMAVSGYVVHQLASVTDLPFVTMMAEEVEIDVAPLPKAVASSSDTE